MINVFPHYCFCGHKPEISDHFRVEQKIEITPINPYVTEYRLHEGYCSICRKKRTASLPEGIRADLLGDHAKTIVSALSGFFHNSKRDVQQILQDVFHLPISLDIVLVDIEDTPPTNTEIHKELCNVLSNSIRIFNKRMNETASSTIPYDTHIDAIKALDILVNTFEKLYQNPREGTKQQELPALGDLQIKIAHEILKEPIEDDSLKTRVQNIFEEHQKQKDHVEEFLKG